MVADSERCMQMVFAEGGSGDSSDGRTLYVNGLTFKATKESIT